MLVAGVCTLAALACLGQEQAIAKSARRTISPLPASEYSVRPVCAPPRPGGASCLGLELVPETAAARARTHPLGIARSVSEGANAEGCTVKDNCYGLTPEDLRSAYGLPETSSAAPTQTIALVDAFNDPEAEADLEVYDQALGLSACTASNGCFKEINQKGETGKPPFPHTIDELKAARKGSEAEREEAVDAGGWAGEISADVQTAHALCQQCHILLVEADSEATSDLETAEVNAVRAGATEVSNSWFTREPEPSTDSPAFNDPGTVITAAAGDEGYLNWDATPENGRGLVSYPASSPHVVAVGGTRLELESPSHARKNELVWDGKGPGEGGRGAGGSGCSERFAAPPWQQEVPDWSSVGCAARRAVADVAADADPFTGVAVYDSTPNKSGAVEKWEKDFGGTSLASPIIAAVFALAGGAHGVEYPAQTLYENALKDPGSLYDVISGSNGKCSEKPTAEGLSGCSALEEAAASCESKAICLAGPEYDGPTGLGTPDGLAAFEPPEGVAPRSTQLLEITSVAPGFATAGGPAYAMTASATSGLAVSFSSATPEVCSVAGSTVSLAAVGTCTIYANQTGDTEYDPAPQGQQSFPVHRGEQTLAFTSSAPAPALVAGATYTVTASASSGLGVAFSSATPTVCSVVNSPVSLSTATVSFSTAGTCTIDAVQPGDASYFEALEEHQSFTVARKPQLIEFTSSAPEAPIIAGPTYTVTAMASSGGAVSLSSATPSVCPLKGATVSFIAAGTCTIDAEQAGSPDYEPAARTQQSFTVAKDAQLIEFTSSAPEAATVGGASYLVAARSSSGLPVSVFSATPSACFVTVSTVSFVGVGTCTLDATQSGSPDYAPAPLVAQSFAVDPASTLVPALVTPSSPSSSVLSFTSSAPPPPTPDSAFSVLGKPKVNSKSGALTFTASALNPGSFSWLLTCHKKIVFGRGTMHLAAAGTVRFTVKPSAAAGKALASALAHGTGLSIAATLTFQSSLGGAPSSHTQSLIEKR